MRTDKKIDVQKDISENQSSQQVLRKEDKRSVGVVLSHGVKAARESAAWRGIKKHPMLYLFVFPSLFLILLLNLGSSFGIIIAFQEYNVVEGVSGSEWIGWKNFISAFASDSIWGNYVVFRNTIFISLIRILTNFPVILIFTLLLNEIKQQAVRKTIQAISYIPHFISMVAVGGMMYTLLSNDGIINQIIVACGGTAVDWYSKADAWWWILALASLWKGMGWATLVYLSGLGAIDSELYDACTVDGGGRFNKMIHVTIPGIMNVIILQLILDIGNLMSDSYSQIVALTHGSTTLSSHLRTLGELTHTAMKTGDGLGRATALSLVQSFFGLLLMLTADWIAKKTDNEGVL